MRKPLPLAHMTVPHGAWRTPGNTGARTSTPTRAPGNLLKYRLMALLIIALVAVTAAGWVLLGAHELALFRSTGTPAIVTALTPVAQAAQGGTAADSLRPAIDPGALMPYWMIIDLLIFVALGLYLRWSLNRKD